MSAAPAPSRSESPAPPQRRTVLVRVLLGALVLDAVFVLAVMLHASGTLTSVPSAADLGWELLFDLWALAPVAGMAAVVLLARRRWPAGLVVAGLGVVALVGLTGWALLDFLASESSTSALVFLFLPPYLWVAVVVTVALAWAVHALRDRQRGPRSSSGG